MNGSDCPGPNRITQTCNTGTCGGSYSRYNIKPDTCYEFFLKYTENRDVVLDPGFGFLSAWSGWESWGRCTYSCGGGIRQRLRTCVGGTDCTGDRRDDEGCNKQPCPCECKHDINEKQDNYTQEKQNVVTKHSAEIISKQKLV